MKRFIAAAASGLLLSVAAAGLANAADVTVTIGPELQKQSASYGDREVERLRQNLADTVQRALTKAGPTAPSKVDLVLESATPNRPTYNQLTAQTSMSLSSIGLGGAAITGSVTSADGVVKPLSYRWRETDIRQVVGYVTWTDADRAFQSLASQLAKGKVPNAGPYRPDLTASAAFSSTNRLR